MQTIIYKKRHKITKNKKVKNQFLGILQFGVVGLKTQTGGVLTQKQLETVRRIIAQATKRMSKVKIRVGFHQPITKKSLLSRMGKGVGGIKGWVSHVKAGSILLEVSNVQIKAAINALQVSKTRLPLKTKIVYKDFF